MVKEKMDSHMQMKLDPHYSPLWINLKCTEDLTIKPETTRRKYKGNASGFF
jgi:hypothetical protein